MNCAHTYMPSLYMYNPNSASRPWSLYVQDMIEFCSRVMDNSAGLDRSTFLSTRVLYDASLRNLTLIGEAATHIPNHVRENHPEIPWRAIVGARNVMMHDYLGIDNQVVWSIIKDAIPELYSNLYSISNSDEQ